MEFNELLNKSRIYLEDQISRCNSKYGLDQCNRMEYEQEKGQMIFSSLATPKIIADFQIAGSFSRDSGTWLWSWDNPYLLDNVVETMWKVKEFGEKHGIYQLVEPTREAGEEEGWDMTAIAAYVLKAKGAYRFPSDLIMTFAIFTGIRKVLR